MEERKKDFYFDKKISAYCKTILEMQNIFNPEIKQTDVEIILTGVFQYIIDQTIISELKTNRSNFIKFMTYKNKVDMVIIDDNKNQKRNMLRKSEAKRIKDEKNGKVNNYEPLVGAIVPDKIKIVIDPDNMEILVNELDCQSDDVDSDNIYLMVLTNMFYYVYYGKVKFDLKGIDDPFIDIKDIIDKNVSNYNAKLNALNNANKAKKQSTPTNDPQKEIKEEIAPLTSQKEHKYNEFANMTKEMNMKPFVFIDKDGKDIKHIFIDNKLHYCNDFDYGDFVLIENVDRMKEINNYFFDNYTMIKG